MRSVLKSGMIFRSRTIFLLVLLVAGVAGGIYLGATVYYSKTSESYASLGCSYHLIEEILLLDHYNSSLDGRTQFLVYNQGSSPTALADIFIDNSNVTYTFSPSSRIGPVCSETTR